MKTRLATLIFLALLPIGFTHAQADSEPEDGEVIVIADLNRAEVRQFIREVEEELYRIFNANNDNDDFDIFCRRERPTGSNIRQWVCEPQFMTAARAKNANDDRLGIDELLTPEQLRADLQSEFTRLTEMMEAMASENAQFAEVAGILAALRARLAQLEN